MLGHQLMAVKGPTLRVLLCTWRLMAFFWDSYSCCISRRTIQSHLVCMGEISI